MDTPVLVFVNILAGGGFSSTFIRHIESNPLVHLVCLPRDAATWIETHSPILTHPSLRVFACGGDGTSNWVLTLLNSHYGFGDLPNRPPVAVLPFGTGNDMSRALGWGGLVSGADVRHPERLLLPVLRSNVIKQVDVWRISIMRSDTHDVTIRHMLNYFSVGCDAEIAYDWERCRHGPCARCYCCSCMAQACYVPAGVRNMCGKRPLGEYMAVELQEGDGASRALGLLERDKTLVFQAIPSMYAGLDPWTIEAARGMDDRLFEVSTQGGAWSVAFFQIGCKTARPICQAAGARIETTEPCYVQTDGEGEFVNGPAVLVIDREGSYPMVFKSMAVN